MSNREIEDFIKIMYGTEVSPSLISRITDRILPEIREWQNRPLKTSICHGMYGCDTLSCT